MNADLIAQYSAPQPIVPQCEGCGRVEMTDEVGYCSVYRNPEYKWSVGACNTATHVKSEVVMSAKKLNPLKASKKAARGR